MNFSATFSSTGGLAWRFEPNQVPVFLLVVVSVFDWLFMVSAVALARRELLADFDAEEV